MQKHITRYYALILAVIGIICIIGSIVLDLQRQTKAASHGVVNYPQEKGEVIALNGEWEYYYDQILYSEDFQKGTYKPSYTQTLGFHGNTHPIKKGMTTYRLRIQLDSQYTNLGLSIPALRVVSQVIINDDIIIKKRQLEANYISAVVPIESKNNTVEVIIHVANRMNIKRGIGQDILFGDYKILSKMQLKQRLMDALIIFSLLVLALVYLSSYLMAIKKDQLYLMIALFCVAFALSNNGYSDRLLFFALPDVFIFISRKIIAAVNYANMIIYACILYQIYRNRLFLLMLKGVTFIFGGYSICILLLPIQLTFHYRWVFTIAGLIIMIFSLGSIAYKLIKKDYGLMSKSSVTILFIALLYSFTYTLSLIGYRNGIFNSLRIAQMSSILFCMIMTIYLANQFNEYCLEIENKKDQLLAMDKLKDEFLMTTTHELQTPLNGIINITESIYKEKLGNINDHQKEHLSLVVNVSKRLALLIEDIKDLSRIKKNDLSLNIKENVEIVSIIRAVTEMLRFTIQHKSLNIINKIDQSKIFVEGDENRIIQIIYNIIGNAVKFTPKGQITIDSIQEKEYILIKVEDTGIGIDDEYHKDLFVSHERIINNYEGMGIGLKLCKSLIEKMGGDIYLGWSELGKGSRFVIRFKKGYEAHNRINDISNHSIENVDDNMKPSIDRKSKNTKHTILVIDDEPSNVYSVQSILKSENIETIVAGNGKEAMDMIACNLLDLIILDIMLPEISGFDLCKEIRKQYNSAEIPIIMVTAKNTIDDVKLGFEAGANDFLTKPFNSDELLARVKTLLQLKEAINMAHTNEKKFLLAQIKPHFIYNTLGSIGVLCRTNSEKANELIDNLSVYLRKVLKESSEKDRISLASELELVEAYLDIEKVRLGERLKIVADIDVNADEMIVPPLILQPIIENAVQHGIASQLKRGKLELMIKEYNDFIHFVVTDDGIGMKKETLENIFESSKLTKNIGLKNINRRLMALYNEKLKIKSNPNEGTRVEFIVPKEKEVSNAKNYNC